MRLALVVLFALLLGLIVDPRSALGCTPVRGWPFPVDRRVRDAAAVFDGVVLAISDTDSLTAPPIEVTFRVLRVWKGPTQPTIIIATERGSTACGMDFVTGEPYLVYAYPSARSRPGSGVSFDTGFLTGTREIETAAEDLAYLGPAAFLPIGPPVSKSALAVPDRTQTVAVPTVRYEIAVATALGLVVIGGAGIVAAIVVLSRSRLP